MGVFDSSNEAFLSTDYNAKNFSSLRGPISKKKSRKTAKLVIFEKWWLQNQSNEFLLVWTNWEQQELVLLFQKTFDKHCMWWYDIQQRAKGKTTYWLNCPRGWYSENLY